MSLPATEEEEQPQQHQGGEEEFVSDSHRVSSEDMAEADEAMKSLGLVGKVGYLARLIDVPTFFIV